MSLWYWLLIVLLIAIVLFSLLFAGEPIVAISVFFVMFVYYILFILILFVCATLLKIFKLMCNEPNKQYKNVSQPSQLSLAEIDAMGGFEFEKYMKQVYETLGYSVHHTPLSGDQGADLILTSNEGIRTAVQVKRYSYKVPNTAVQEVVAAKAFYKCTEGMVVTNNYFTDSAKQLAHANNIGLVDRYGLQKLHNRLPRTEPFHNEIAMEKLANDMEWANSASKWLLGLADNGSFNAVADDLTNQNFDKAYKKCFHCSDYIRNGLDASRSYNISSKYQPAKEKYEYTLSEYSQAIQFCKMYIESIKNGNPDQATPYVEDFNYHIGLGTKSLSEFEELMIKTK